MIKLTSMSNTLPPINAHARTSLDDIYADDPSETTGNTMPTKQQNIRRQQSIDRQRRNPMRSTGFVPPTGNKYMSTSPSVVPNIASPFASTTSLVRSPSIIHTSSPAQNEPHKTIYRSSDGIWNEHQNNPNASTSHLRSNSPIKNKLVVLSQRLSNGTLHENTSGSPGKSMPHIPISPQLQHTTRDVPNHADLLLSSATKSYQATRRRHTNSFLDKAPGTIDYTLSMRKDIDRSQVVNNGMRTRQISSKQRNYVNSKTSFYEINEKDIHTGVPIGEHTPPINSMGNTQRLYESTFDLTANKKALSPNKSRSFHVPANGLGQQVHYNSTQDVHGNEMIHDRNDYTIYGVRRATSKEQMAPTSKYRRISGDQSVTTTTQVAAAAVVEETTAVTYVPGDRHPSAQTYESRDPNISYAYTNVKKYIEENALMPPEKEQLIRKWILDVEKHKHDLQKIE